MSEALQADKPNVPESFTGVRVEEAKSGRSKCKACREQIEGGNTRVGVETFQVVHEMRTR